MFSRFRCHNFFLILTCVNAPDRDLRGGRDSLTSPVLSRRTHISARARRRIFG
jgi:hypothetical protein